MQSSWFGFCIVVSFLVLISSAAKESTTPERRLQPVDLGYNGTWDKFCNHSEIENDFAMYPGHELRRMRLSTCNLRRQNLMSDEETLSVMVICKHGYEIRPRLDEVLLSLVEKFSQNDTFQRGIILDAGPVVQDTVCFTESIAAVDRTCIESDNPYFGMFRRLIARACTVMWLKPNLILTYIQQTCKDGEQRISGKIDWPGLANSIKDKLEMVTNE